MTQKTQLLFGACIIFLSTFISSCSKYEEVNKGKESSSFNNSESMEIFSIALSKACFEYQEVRDIIKSESLQKFDNDYDVLYQSIKDKYISDNKTFRDVIQSYLSGTFSMDEIENNIPDLTILVSDVTWIDPEGFCPKRWDTKDEHVAVTYKSSKGRCEKLFANGVLLGEIEDGSIPGCPALIVKRNERIIVSAPTKSGEFNYQFIDDVFDGKAFVQTKSNRYSGRYSTSWIAGQDPEDNSDIMSAATLNSLNPDIVAAFNMFNGNSTAHQNDYIYYGMTPSSPTGALRSDVRSKIVRFKISPRSFNALFDDPQDSDMNFSDSYETDDNGYGYGAEPSVSTIYSKLWADGALEIKVRIATLGSDGNVAIDNFYYDVKASDLFTIKDYAIKKEEWGSTIFKWYITWKYSLDRRDESTLVEKWYYPENTPDLPTWDLIQNSAYSIIVSEEDTGATTTRTWSTTTKKASQFTSKVSPGGSTGQSVTLKGEFGWSYTDETTTSTNTSISWVNSNDEMTQKVITFADKYIQSQASASTYNVFSHQSDRFTFTILPYRY